MGRIGVILAFSLHISAVFGIICHFLSINVQYSFRTVDSRESEDNRQILILPRDEKSVEGNHVGLKVLHHYEERRDLRAKI